MRAAVLTAPGVIALREVPDPVRAPGDVLLRPIAVGVCGTDLHIFSGEGNYNLAPDGRALPLSTHPQILGHEIVAEVLDGGALPPRTRVVVDQGLNCRSRGRAVPCIYCSTGHSHHCAHYSEHGISGLPGGMAERLAIPACNVLAIPTTLDLTSAAFTEPLACVLHACEVLSLARHARFQWEASESARRINTIAIAGAGPAGQLFVQVLRNVFGFRGRVLVSDPSPFKRDLAAQHGAEALDARAAPFDELVRAATAGEGAELVIEASGVGQVFAELPGALRRQGTVLLYAHGHGGTPLSALNALHWLEPVLLLPNGASGGLGADGRPLIYERALTVLAEGAVRPEALVSKQFHGLEAVSEALGSSMAEDEIKRVLTF
jgi:L-iditol 2-dehydrogenase